ncbi:hypothetical protein F7O44_11480 [Phytoactinopolyspora sp. XMNu-373]|uniref:Uncharacterized protein n=2 Tax=Phytoactinopolyspora mesophila TaxID=2650750 RepID=A0A7K3M372_9ACTN|nr:hypothetical protein [Phytoactinopolyspora mesophila]
MGSRLLASAGVIVIAGAVAFTLIGGASDGSSEDTTATAKVIRAASKPIVLPPSPSDSDPVQALHAEPEGGDELILTVPENVNGWDEVTFTAEWNSSDAGPVHAVVDLQEVDGDTWENVAEIELGDEGGSVELDVSETGIYRLAYGGSDEMEATVSNDVTVVTTDLLPSRVTATASPTDDGMAEVIATWTTEAGVAIVGELELQAKVGDTWETVTEVTTDADSTAEIEVDAAIGDEFRFVYPGGDRFDEVKSDTGVVLSDDVRNIEVRVCNNSTDIDNLPYGVACHYAPVTVDTFVAAHDYLGNAWWNAMPMGTLVELEGEQAGIYEVVDRVIAPGRGAALGSASNWACGDACDVILQTCQGANTGFTWLRQID